VRIPKVQQRQTNLISSYSSCPYILKLVEQKLNPHSDGADSEKCCYFEIGT
jgi:hypothetical protein